MAKIASIEHWIANASGAWSLECMHSLEQLSEAYNETKKAYRHYRPIT